MGLSIQNGGRKARIDVKGSVEGLVSNRGLTEARSHAPPGPKRRVSGDVPVQTDVPHPERAEVRAYILAMTGELADMAERVRDNTLAESLRKVARSGLSRPVV